MDKPSSLINSAIEQLNKHTYGGFSMRREVIVALDFLKTFLLVAERWSSVDDNVDRRLCNLMADIGNEFANLSSELEVANEGGEEAKIAVYSQLNGKIEQFKAKVKEEYEYLSQYSSDAPSPITDVRFWERLIDAAYGRLKVLNSSTKLSSPLKKEAEALREDIWSFRRFIGLSGPALSSVKPIREICVFIGAVATSVERVSYACWLDGTNPEKAEELMDLLSELRKRIKPSSTQTIDKYIRVLKVLGSHNSMFIHSTSSYIYGIATHWIQDWVSFEDQKDSLSFLTLFLVNIPEELSNDDKLSLDIKTVIAEAVSLSSTSSPIGIKRDLKLCILAGKVEILMAEAAVKGIVHTKEPMETPSRGVKMLQKFLKHPPEGTNEKGKMMLMHIEAVATGAALSHNKFHGMPISEYAQDEFKLLLNIKLLKAEIFWFELMDRSASYNDYIDTLLQGLEDLRRFALWKPDGNSESVKPIFGHVHEVVSQAMLIYHSIHNNEDAENFANEMSNSLPHLLDRIHQVKAEAENVHISVPEYSFPKTHGLGFLEFFLDNLRKLMEYDSDSVNRVKHLLKEVQMSLTPFLQDNVEQSISVIQMAYEADEAVDSILLGSGDKWYHLMLLTDLILKIKDTKTRVQEITTQKISNDIDTKLDTTTLNKISNDDFIIRLPEKETEIIRHLTEKLNRRDVVSIVGTGGIGKTTFAEKLFVDPRVTEQFDPRAWCSISGVYQPYHKRDLLLQLLRNIPKQKEQTKKDLDFNKASDEDLASELYRRLHKRKYLIVIDGLSDIQAWLDLRNSFPDKKSEGKILITSRNSEIRTQTGGSSEPVSLTELSEDDSWKLLEAKVFHGQVYSKKFKETGMEIAKGCKGLPLALVVIAGVLEKKKDIDQWKKIAEDINSGSSEDIEKRCMSILRLSYEDLPNRLKPCFLYLGAFWGNIKIPVKKLELLWIAEGFVRKPFSSKDALAEDEAEDYLRGLISRNLIIGTEEISRGRFKFCKVRNDILQTLCLSIVAEANFLQLVKGYENLFPEGTVLDDRYSGLSITYEQYRLSIHSQRNHFSKIKPSGSHVRSLLFFATSGPYPTRDYNLLLEFEKFRLLRVLDLETINLGKSFPLGIKLLKQLRYLAVTGDFNCVPLIVAEIWNLETFVVKTFFVKEREIVQVPEAIWSMPSLRLLYVHDAKFHPEEGQFKTSSELGNLATLSSPRLSCDKDAQIMMKRFSCLRNLRCQLLKSDNHSSKCQSSPVLGRLTKLESLKISYYGGTPYSCEFHFVTTLKKLTISNCRLPKDYASKLGALAKLKVLKLQSVEFDDPTQVQCLTSDDETQTQSVTSDDETQTLYVTSDDPTQTWDASEQVYKSLEYLKLDNLDIIQWIADYGTFPSLHRLVLKNCRQLEGLPDGFMLSTTLEAIELQMCSQSAKTSAKEIQAKLLRRIKNFKLFIDLLD